MKKLFLLVVLVFLVTGCTAIDGTTKTNIVTVNELLAGSDNQTAPLLAEEYNEQTIYLKGQLKSHQQCGSCPAHSLPGCIDCWYFLRIFDESPSREESFFMLKYLNGQTEGFSSLGEAFQKIGCSLNLQEEGTYIFKGKPELKKWEVPMTNKQTGEMFINSGWNLYFTIEDCYEI